MFRQGFNRPSLTAFVVQLLPIVLEEFAVLAAPPSGHSLFTNDHVIKENAVCHEQVDWYALLGRNIHSKLGLAFNNGYASRKGF
jgi:hypothetical protein